MAQPELPPKEERRLVVERDYVQKCINIDAFAKEDTQRKVFAQMDPTKKLAFKNVGSMVFHLAGFRGDVHISLEKVKVYALVTPTPSPLPPPTPRDPMDVFENEVRSVLHHAKNMAMLIDRLHAGSYRVTMNLKLGDVIIGSEHRGLFLMGARKWGIFFTLFRGTLTESDFACSQVLLHETHSMQSVRAAASAKRYLYLKRPKATTQDTTSMKSCACTFCRKERSQQREKAYPGKSAGLALVAPFVTHPPKKKHRFSVV